MGEHFELTGETRGLSNMVLHRIRATCDFEGEYFRVKAGELGGWVENPENLRDNAWVADEAMLYGNAVVCDEAYMYERAMATGNSVIFGNVLLRGDTKILMNSQVGGHYILDGHVNVFGNPIIDGVGHIEGKFAIADNARITGGDLDGSGFIGGNARITKTTDFLNVSIPGIAGHTNIDVTLFRTDKGHEIRCRGWGGTITDLKALIDNYTIPGFVYRYFMGNEREHFMEAIRLFDERLQQWNNEKRVSY